MKIGARVEVIEAFRLTREEQKALKRICRFTKKTRVMVSYSENFADGLTDPSFDRVASGRGVKVGAFLGVFGIVHEPNCAAVAFNAGEPYWDHSCNCKAAEMGWYATRRFLRQQSASGLTMGRVVMRRFVPRPLTLDQAILYEDVDLSVLAVEASWLMDRGYPIGEHIAQKIYAARKEAA